MATRSGRQLKPCSMRPIVPVWKVSHWEWDEILTRKTDMFKRVKKQHWNRSVWGKWQRWALQWKKECTWCGHTVYKIQHTVLLLTYRHWMSARQSQDIDLTSLFSILRICVAYTYPESFLLRVQKETSIWEIWQRRHWRWGNKWQRKSLQACQLARAANISPLNQILPYPRDEQRCSSRTSQLWVERWKGDTKRREIVRL